MSQLYQPERKFATLQSLEDVKTQLDMMFASLFDALNLNPTVKALNSALEPAPEYNSGDVVADFTNGVYPVFHYATGNLDQKLQLDFRGVASTVAPQQHFEQPATYVDGDGLGHLLHPLATETEPGFFIAAPADGNLYGMFNNVWTIVDIPTEAEIIGFVLDDAPTDGDVYGVLNNDWSKRTATPGSNSPGDGVQGFMSTAFAWKLTRNRLPTISNVRSDVEGNLTVEGDWKIAHLTNGGTDYAAAHTGSNGAHLVCFINGAIRYFHGENI